MIKPCYWIFSIFLFLLIYDANANPMADLIVNHARIWTGDPSRPEAQAVAIQGDRIVDVGTDSSMEMWKGPKTKVIDAGGKLLMPGFNDAHVHFVSGGMQL